MDFVLNKKQIKEFIERCVASRSEQDNKQYQYQFVTGEYPDIWIELTSDDGYSQSYNVILAGRVPYTNMTGPICKDMQKIYIAYMYEIFGEQFLISLEKEMRKEIIEAKQAALKNYNAETNKLDCKLIDFLLLLSNAKNDVLNQ